MTLNPSMVGSKTTVWIRPAPSTASTGSEVEITKPWPTSGSWRHCPCSNV
jgi:hypothetical protein